MSFPASSCRVTAERRRCSASTTRAVRAADGRAVLRHGRSRAVRLRELPIEDRPAVLRAYASQRAFSRSPAYVARNYFGVDPTAGCEDFTPLAPRYPVFLVEP